MKGWVLVLVWFACVIIGAAIGVGIGYILWKLGFPLIGSAVMLVGAAVGGILAFFAVMRWSEQRQYGK